MTGRYDYERFINYFQHITQEFVDDWWFGIKYRIIDDTCEGCIVPKTDFKDQKVYLYKPQLLYSELDPYKESIYYFIPLKTLQNMKPEQVRNTMKVFADDVLIKKCKAERKLRELEKDF